MVRRLDIKDTRILHALDANSRRSNSEIAKLVGLSKQVVGLRIKHLVEDSVLSWFYTVLDVSKLGFSVHRTFVRLQNLNQSSETRLLHYLCNHPDVVWVASCDGKYDLAFGVRAKDMEDLDRVIREFDKHFGQHVTERQIATIIRGEFFHRNYLKPGFSHSSVPLRLPQRSFAAVSSLAQVDKTDWKILSCIGSHSRKSAVDIAKTVHLSPDTVGKRIRTLEHQGVIRGYNIVPNETVYPFLHYKVLIGLRNLTSEKEKSLMQFCADHPNIFYIVKALGAWEFEIDLEVENATKLRAILMDLKTKYSDIIKDYSALHIYQVHKYNFCPSPRG